MRVLVVCHGNKWRSPLAAELLRRRHPDWEVRGAGVGPTAAHGWPAARPVRLFTGGLDNHRSRLVTPEDLAWADRIICMDNGNLRRLRALGVDEAKVTCWGVRDPAFTRVGSSEQRAVFEMIQRKVGEL